MRRPGAQGHLDRVPWIFVADADGPTTVGGHAFLPVDRDLQGSPFATMIGYGLIPRPWAPLIGLGALCAIYLQTG